MEQKWLPDDIDDLLCEIPRVVAAEDPHRSSFMHCGGGGGFVDGMKLYNGFKHNHDEPLNSSSMSQPSSTIDSSLVSSLSTLNIRKHLQMQQQQEQGESLNFAQRIRSGILPRPSSHDSFSNNIDITNNINNNHMINNKMYTEFPSTIHQQQQQQQSKACNLAPSFVYTPPWDAADEAEMLQQQQRAQMALEQRLVQQHLDRQRHKAMLIQNQLVEAYGYHLQPSTTISSNQGIFSPYAGRVAGSLLSSLNAQKHAQQLAALRLAAAAAAAATDSRVRSTAGSTCRFYAQGFCSRAESCPFLHISAKEKTSSAAGGYTRDALAAVLVSPEDRFCFPDVRRKKDVLSNGFLTSRNCVKKQPDERISGFPPSDQLAEEAATVPAPDNLEFATAGAGDQKYTSLDEVVGQIFSLAKDQNGCRFLQKKFDEGNAEDIRKIFVEIIDQILDLMTDPFGNYLVQKLLDVSNDAQRNEILRVVTRNGQLVSISLNVHGTRAVQKLVETLKSPDQIALVTGSLRQGIVTLIQDLNGNHVVQKCLQRLGNEDNQFIFDAAAHHCVEIATHRHGCCVLQRCVDFSSGAQRQLLVSEIASNALILSQDQYGNYVVQYILELGPAWATEVMLRLEGNYALLAMQKFSSNVVEKCLKQAQDELRVRIIREITTSALLAQLLQDPFANYVIQCALSVTKGPLHAALVEAIRPHSAVLRSSPYGKRILSRVNSTKK